MDENKKEVRVRFAPSPTGELHIGGLRTALSDYLFARKNNGKFILRIEDTDQKRLVDGAIERIVESLQWAGIEIDEGIKLVKSKKLKIESSGKNSKYQTPNPPSVASTQHLPPKGGEKKTPVIVEAGEYGPYIQSERLDIYKKYIQKLVDEDKAYYCFCSADRLDDMRKEQQKNKQAPKYDRCCLGLSEEEVQEKITAGEKFVVRFRIPEGKTVFEDLVYGKIEVDNSDIDDQVIMKSDGFPTYHLAVVVDDYLMKISHIFRGAEWIASTPKHILLYEALGWKKDMPEFAHMPNILNKDRKKLSKREGSVSVQDFKEQGYPAEAIVNFIALLGWNPKTEQEIFSMTELIEQFDISKMNRSGGAFDLDRLAWISKEHIKKMSADELYKQALPFLEQKEFYQKWVEKAGKEKESYIKKILLVEQSRLEKFTQAGEENQFFFNDDFAVSADEMRWKNSTDEETKENLQKAKVALKEISEENWELKNIEEKLLKVAGDKRGDLLFPLRAVLTGQKKSPSPFEVSWVLGREESLRRIEKAI